VNPRNEALAEISEALLAIKRDIEQRIPRSRAHANRVQGHVVKLVVAIPEAQIKIEPNLVLRGALHKPQRRDLCPTAQQPFEAFVSIATLSEADLYGGKLCAALDRQHPRDLFDVKLLMDDVGIAPEIRRAFVVYLAAHSRPMRELLSPNFLDIEAVYSNLFIGMTRVSVSLRELLEVRQRLVEDIVANLDDNEKAFLLSINRGEPEWDLLGFDHLHQMPALRWKLLNIGRMSDGKRSAAIEGLRDVLSV